MIGHLAFYFGAFILALGVLIVVHEFGHFVVARLCGVKVLRFSVGFGRTLLVRRFGADGTEWAICVFPLGGYVKMLDEGEGPVEPQDLPRAFNRLSVWRRMLVVVAGPLANLLLAVLLYWLLFMHGSEELRPVLAVPPAATAAAAAGVQDGETVRSFNGKPVVTWQELRWELAQVVLDHAPVVLEVINPQQEISFRNLDTRDITEADLEGDLPGHLGLKLFHPSLKPIAGEITPGSAAAQAGIRAGDEFVAIDGKAISSWNDVVTIIRKSPGVPLQFELHRAGAVLDLQATPTEIRDGMDGKGVAVGRLGITVQDDPALRETMFIVRSYDPLTAFGKATRQTSETALFTLRMIGRMIVGEVSLKNLSGPVTIADYAGQSAQHGWVSYLTFMALISISLGVLNLLPIPILDGGHLLYYVAEVVKGGPLSGRIMEIGQQIGLALLMMLMAFAFYNDINRLVSG